MLSPSSERDANSGAATCTALPKKNARLFVKKTLTGSSKPYRLLEKAK